MSGKTRLMRWSGAAIAAAALMSVSAASQSASPEGSREIGTSSSVRLAQAQPQGRSRPSASPRAKEDAASRQGSEEAQLRQRVERLEEQLVDMQVVIGTLESLARSPSGATSVSSPSRGVPFAGDDGGRLDSLETQIRALTSQLEQLSEQVHQLGGRRTEAGPANMVANHNPVSRPGDAATYGPGTSALQQEASANTAPRAGGSFGSLTVTPGPGRDPIGGLIQRDPGARSNGGGEATTDAAEAGNPKELYETAYGHLLQQDYGAAQAAFEEFLRLYPNERLSADAQYWLGETLYVQRRYKPAGQAFLKVIQDHKASAKVPNSLLKLAMTLEQLGQKDCALFTELETQHTDAAAEVKSRARVVRQRVGC